MVVANDILGYYRLIERIGVGGMGEVWKAEDTRLGRMVAVKILPSTIASDQEAIARMRREARTAAQHNHPNIATIHSFEEIGERLFIVMEFVEGEPLTKLIGRGPMAEAEVCRIGRAVAEALAEAHSKGVIHRDIKPDNIIVSGSRVKVLDFGIAKQVGVQSSANDPTAFLTQQGMIVGTVHYMSPEQALGKQLDSRTDIFSLGVVLYQAATGRLPFAGETVTETITRIVRDEPPPPARLNPRVSAEMTSIIARCLKKNRKERYANANELAAALETQLTRATTAPMKTAASAPPTVIERPKKKRSWVAIPIVLGGAVVAAVVFWPPAPGTVETVTNAAVPASGTGARPGAAAPAPTTAVTARRLFSEGVADLLGGNEAKARREFEGAIALDPHDTKAYLGLAIVNGNRERARKLAHEIQLQNPNDPDLQTLRRFIRMEVEQRQAPPQGPRRRLRP